MGNKTGPGGLDQGSTSTALLNIAKRQSIIGCSTTTFLYCSISGPWLYTTRESPCPQPPSVAFSHFLHKSQVTELSLDDPPQPTCSRLVEGPESSRTVVRTLGPTTGILLIFSDAVWTQPEGFFSCYLGECDGTSLEECNSKHQ